VYGSRYARGKRHFETTEQRREELRYSFQEGDLFVITLVSPELGSTKLRASQFGELSRRSFTNRAGSYA
jgi:hypothetical protein